MEKKKKTKYKKFIVSVLRLQARERGLKHHDT